MSATFAFLAFTATGCQSTKQVQSGGEVHGFVVANLAAQGKPATVMPNVEVYLKDSKGQIVGGRAKTDGYGRFAIPSNPVGTYTVCAKADGFAEQCDPEAFELGVETHYPAVPILLTPPAEFVSGRIVMSDGTPCFHDSRVFHSHVQGEAHIVTADGKDTHEPAVVNADGAFVLSRKPDQNEKLQLLCGNLEVQTSASGGPSALAVKTDTYVSRNRAPKILAIDVALGGRIVHGAPPGATVAVTVKATDGDQDTLHYKWSGGESNTAFPDASTISWKLSDANATNMLFVEVSDGRGGFANSRIAVISGPDRIGHATAIADFHGRLLGKDGVPENRFFPSAALANVTTPIPTHNQPFLSIKNTDCEKVPRQCIKETLAYYQSIGAIPGKDTLEKFRASNGFDQGETTAIYFNAGDLGFGREMHCHQSVGTDPDVACYVTNYGSIGDPNAAVAQAIAHEAEVATVGMEYSVLPNGSAKGVKFYVWNGHHDLINQANLDSEGFKSVPQICLVCHGGNYSEATHSATGASFREFDIFSFGYSQQAGFTQKDQIDKFRALNAMVKATRPNSANPNNPIVALIDGMFPANSEPVDYVPSGWEQAGKSQLYTQITRRSCRACHVAQASGIDWTNYVQFNRLKKVIETVVCSARVMPHAEVPFDRFWLSGSDPDYLASPQTGLGFSGSCPTQ